MFEKKLEGLSAALTELGRGWKQGNTLQNVCRESWLLGIDSKSIWFEFNRELIGFYNQLVAVKLALAMTL